MEAVHQIGQAMIRSLKFPAPTPILQRGEELEMESMIDCAYVIKSP